jgi:ABC-type uncharacterized transport system substrate-binding protein
MAVPVDRATAEPFQGAFREGLRNLGYVDGENVIIIERFANGDPAKLRKLIKELIALHVDVLMGEAPLLKEMTTTIPIVSPTMGDPVKTGLVASLARPGGQPHRRFGANLRYLAKTTGVGEGIGAEPETPLFTVRQER